MINKAHQNLPLKDTIRVGSYRLSAWKKQYSYIYNILRPFLFRARYLKNSKVKNQNRSCNIQVVKNWFFCLLTGLYHFLFYQTIYVTNNEQSLEIKIRPPKIQIYNKTAAQCMESLKFYMYFSFFNKLVIISF